MFSKLSKLREGREERNVIFKFISIEEYLPDMFNQVLDLRAEEDFIKDNIVGSKSFPVVQSELMIKICTEKGDIVSQDYHEDRVRLVEHIW